MSMSSANYLLTEEQLLCCICLEVFTDPVTLPCGHNFCKECIRRHLNFNCERKCPMCKEHVDKKYKLGINTFISEMAVQFRRTTGRKVSSSPELNEDTQEKVSCRSSTRTKRTKRMSCFLLALGLMCLTLYFAACQTLHQSLSGLRTHLFDTVEKVPDNLCSRHNKPLKLYCKNEGNPICQSCAESSHRFHDVVPLTEAYKVMLRQLEKAKANIQQSIQEKELKIQDIERSVRLSQEAAVREKTHGAVIFTSLIQSMETAQAELFGMIQEKQKEVETRAQGMIEDLELEILALKRRRTKVEQLSWSRDPLDLMQNFPSINSDLPTKDWTEVSVCPELYLGVMLTVLVKSVKQMSETVAKEMKNQQQVELEQAQQNAVDVTLDPDTAHPALILSDDGKQVHCGDMNRKLPDTPKRFIHAINVLGKQSFSCGKFHYDVEVKGKTAWTIGVAQHSINRKGKSQLNPENGCWSLSLRNRTMYFALDKHPVPITVNYHPEKIKVFVDYDEGLVSFYDADAADPLFSFKGCSFTERLHPFFSPGASDGGRNTAPLIISPVHQYTGN